MRTFVYCILFIFIAVAGYSQKTIRIKFLDSISHEAIPFLFIENPADSTSDFTNLDGVIKLNQKATKQTYLISHISYSNRFILLDLTRDNTVYLAPAAIGLQEVVVEDARRDIEAMLTEVLRHLRKDKTTYHNQYGFYLETKYNGKRFEKIKAVFGATYTHREGVTAPQLMDGEFWFNPDSLFINLDMDTWLLAFDPLAKKPRDDAHYLLTNVDKIKKSKQRLTLMDCKVCPAGYELFFIEDGHQSIKIMANLQSKKIANYQVSLKPSSSLFFKNLISDDTTKVEGVDINYLFGSDGNLDKIVFKIQLNDRLHRVLDIAGFFTRVHYEKGKNIFYFGPYRPTTLYEKILMDPDVNRYRIDTLFKNNQYAEFKINNSSGLWSNDEGIRSYFFSKGTFDKKIRMWSVDRKPDASQVKVSIDYADHNLLKQPPELMPQITWIFSQNKKDGKRRSLPSIWSAASKIDHYSDSNNTLLSMGMAFDLAELARMECKHTDTISIRQYYEDKLYGIAADMSLVLEDRLSYKKLYQYNQEIDKQWGINNLLTAYQSEIPTILKQPRHKSFADKFSKEAFDLYYEQGDTSMGANFSRLSIEMYLHLLEYYGDKLGYKHKGGVHAVLADLYYLLHDELEACKHFLTALKIWPEANQACPKRKLMSLCGVK